MIAKREGADVQGIPTGDRGVQPERRGPTQILDMLVRAVTAMTWIAVSDRAGEPPALDAAEHGAVPLGEERSYGVACEGADNTL